MKWFRVYDKNGCLNSHIFPDSLEMAMREDINIRHPEVVDWDLCFQEKPSYYIDLPGMLTIGRPTVEFDLEGTPLEIPCEDVSIFIDRVESAKERSNKYGTFFKVGGFLQCLVLSPETRASLLRQMKESIDMCEIRSMEFLASLEPGIRLPRTNGSKSYDDPPVYFDPQKGGFVKFKRGGE